MNGNAVIYDVGKILAAAERHGVPGSPARAISKHPDRRTSSTSTAARLTPVVTTRVSDMAYARSFANSVVLPDGKVLVLGGQQHPQAFTDTGGVHSPELWDPATGAFTILAPEVVPRTYHSVAILLPDARVFSGGGGLCGSCLTNHPNGQILTPPYLLNPDGSARARPSITSAPATAASGLDHHRDDQRSHSRIRDRPHLGGHAFRQQRPAAHSPAADNHQRHHPHVNHPSRPRHRTARHLPALRSRRPGHPQYRQDDQSRLNASNLPGEWARSSVQVAYDQT